MRIYISGPMRGLPEYNFPAFYAAEAALKAEGHHPINPARIDEDIYGFDRHSPLEDQDFDLKMTIICDVEEILHSDAIYMLDGWWHSLGAFAEWAVARWGKKKVLYQSRWKGLVTLKRLLKKGE